jgi:transposase
LLALTPEGTKALLDDKGYDSNAFFRALATRGIEPVIPARSNRNSPRLYDGLVTKSVIMIECFFNKIKHYRGVFSRYEKWHEITWVLFDMSQP